MKRVVFGYLRKLGIALLAISGSMALSAAPPSSPVAAQHVENQVSLAPQPSHKPKKIGIVLFDGFETLDVFGPVEMWGRLPDYEMVMVSQHGGPVKSAQGIETIAPLSFANAPQFDILMVPGGAGTRTEVNNPELLAFLRKQDHGTEWTTSVCTGSALLAKAGILDGRKATSNKLAFRWAASQSDKVSWQTHARWVIDGKYISSSGVSAGTDMALALVETLYGRELAEHTAHFTEYVWNDDPSNDPFAVNEKP
ncbi:dimethyladenosine transferase [Sphingomonas sp. Root710]|uniref:DJ-1/PfpI family protein n=1 Tax=Sphingomonas sp. Root710 TaxID=1736594 RepID=UPI0006FCFD64|nr:DJ-1/PfpI family protein [Sphingomonas sp. Root710]KRB80682.1 dimethyladenosine transferase [Sphingomonas sp. Root710]